MFNFALPHQNTHDKLPYCTACPFSQVAVFYGMTDKNSYINSHCIICVACDFVHKVTLHFLTEKSLCLIN
jgi:hypothetical protein